MSNLILTCVKVYDSHLPLSCIPVRYRAPGESWTKKFKHVVGILHTNYFQYVLDQPAALIRVRASCHLYLLGNILRKGGLTLMRWTSWPGSSH
jgi:hypothetical protein